MPNQIKDTELRALWSDFEQNAGDYDEKIKAAKKVLDRWSEYESKILTASLGLTDYANRAVDGDYLARFLEFGSLVFGSSKPGYANNYMVYRNKEGDYCNNKGQRITIGEAQTVFDDEVLPILINVVSSSSSEAYTTFEKNCAYAAKQFLRKTLLLASINKCFLDEISPQDWIDHYSILPVYAWDKLQNVSERIYGKKGEGDILTGKAILNTILNACGLRDGIQTKEDLLLTILKVGDFVWQTFVAGQEVINDLQDNSNLIYYGAPGTGKTYAVTQALKVLFPDETEKAKHCCTIQCHPEFTYGDFIEGIKPTGMTDQGSIRFGIVNGFFKDFCIKAKEAMKEFVPENLSTYYYFVVDEINRANLSALFGETLSLIEEDYRDACDGTIDNERETPLSHLIADLIRQAPEEEKAEYERLAYQYKEGRVFFGIPKNIKFIGTMNDVDKSIEAFDLALRRRFVWKRKDFNKSVLRFKLIEKGYTNDECEKYIASCNKLNEYISGNKDGGLNLGKSYEIGHTYFMTVSGNLEKAKEALFSDRLVPILREYLRGFYSEGEVDSKLEEARKRFGA